MKTRPYDSAEYLTTPAAREAYLQEAFMTADAALIQTALGAVARAQGMSQLAQDAGLNRQSLYRALSAEGRPELETVLKVMDALGFGLRPVAATPTSSFGVAESARPFKAGRARRKPAA